jgi:hypothetical protein
MKNVVIAVAGFLNGCTEISEMKSFIKYFNLPLLLILGLIDLIISLLLKTISVIAHVSIKLVYIKI